MFKRIPFDQVNWVTSSFLIGTLLITCTFVPWFLWNYDLDAFTWSMFAFYTISTGLSITLGYHRLFSHISFKAKWPVKLFTLLFGAASFENSALDWSREHRMHHKYDGHDNDPYNVDHGFFHAHMGWLLFKIRPKIQYNNVKDLEKDGLVMWQHKWVQWIAVTVSFIVPTIIGWLHNGYEGAMAGFLIVGVARIVLVQHSTFCINSFAHYVGKRPYSTNSSARDSWITALMTFGEGYHNFHHTFQHDYRNGVKAWQFDPTKWMIWVLSKLGLASDLRRVPEERILLAEITEARKQIDAELKSCLPDTSKVSSEILKEYVEKVQTTSENLVTYCKELQDAAVEQIELSKESIEQWRKEVMDVMIYLKRIKALSAEAQKA